MPEGTQARILRFEACRPITLNCGRSVHPCGGRTDSLPRRRPRSGGAAIDWEAVIVGGCGVCESPSRPDFGSYPYFRISLSYQNFDVDLKAENGEVYPTTLASFVGYKHIESFMLNEETIEVNGNKLQGYGGLEILGNTLQGQTRGATTVPNPFWDSAPIPQGSCIVTGAFDKPCFLKTWTTTWC